METIRGEVDGRPAVLQIKDGFVSLEVDGEAHGPRPIRGSVSHSPRADVWGIGLGTIRGRFIPHDPQAMSEAISKELVGQVDRTADIGRLVSEMSSTYEEHLDAWERFLDTVGVVARLDGKAEPDFSKLRQQIGMQRRQYAAFMKHLAPRGWTHCRTLEAPWKNHVVAVAFLETAGADPHAVDAWLSDRVIEHARVTEIINDFSTCPVEAVWQWTCMAAEAARAVRNEMWGPAALTWMTIAEGMWRDLREWTGAASTKFFARGKLSRQRITEVPSRSRESLVVAHDYMSQSVTRTYIEPMDVAPTSRHALLHGRVAGALQKVHAAKAFALVDGIVELAQQAVELAVPTDLIAPPWKP